MTSRKGYQVMFTVNDPPKNVRIIGVYQSLSEYFESLKYRLYFKMRDWLKILLAVGGGAAVALVIALPIVLTGDDAPSVPEDPGD